MRASLIGAAASVLAGVPTLADDTDWSYAGPTGPAVWGALNPAYETCATGRQQSPIDLSAAVPAALDPPRIEWRQPVRAQVANTGRTIEVAVEGAGGVIIGEIGYDLLHFRFHHPSEHTIDGRAFPLEAQFVHAAPDGRLAVISVLFEERRHNDALHRIWEAAEPETGARAPLEALDPRDFLPADPAAYHYAGSLTTPPCSEIVVWTVLARPMPASARQIAAFANVYPHNARPVQPRHRRFILATDR